MHFHSKALQMLTRAFKSIDLMDEQKDLNDFRGLLGFSTGSNLMKTSSAIDVKTVNAAGSLRRFSSTPDASDLSKIEKSKINTTTQEDDDASISSDDDQDNVPVKTTVQINKRRSH